MRARIYKPSKTAMQSGRGNTKLWVLEFEPSARKTPDPLMGWAGSADTSQQVRMRFDTQEEAVTYCKRNGIDYSIMKPRERHIRPKSYAANFRWDRA